MLLVDEPTEGLAPPVVQAVKELLEDVCRAVVEAGARTVNLPDTVGFSVPAEYGELIGRSARRAPLALSA